MTSSGQDRTITKVTRERKHLFNHSCTSGHCGFLEDVTLTFVDKTDSSDPLKREDYWRSTLKNMAPFGFKIAESV